MQKFVPRTRIGIFGNKRKRSTHWTLKSCFGAFCSVSVHLAMFHYYTELGAKWVELVQLMKKFVPRNRIRVFSVMNAPDPPHWMLNSRIGAFCSVWVHFGLFRYCMKLDAK